MSEVLHFTATRAHTACGLDRRGKRSTRDRKLVTCKHCSANLTLNALQGVFERATAARIYSENR